MSLHSTQYFLRVETYCPLISIFRNRDIVFLSKFKDLNQYYYTVLFKITGIYDFGYAVN